MKQRNAIYLRSSRPYPSRTMTKFSSFFIYSSFLSLFISFASHQTTKNKSGSAEAAMMNSNIATNFVSSIIYHFNKETKSLFIQSS